MSGTPLRKARGIEFFKGAFATLSGYRPVDEKLPWKLIGAVMPNNQYQSRLSAYELVTKKFDDFVASVSRDASSRQRGLIIHDRSGVEGALQDWTARWRIASSSLGRLRNLADVPMFADSRATRALQAADLVAYALYRYYSTISRNDQYTKRLWTHFEHNGKMHTLIHNSPAFKNCRCPPCESRH